MAVASATAKASKSNKNGGNSGHTRPRDLWISLQRRQARNSQAEKKGTRHSNRTNMRPSFTRISQAPRKNVKDEKVTRRTKKKPRGQIKKPKDEKKNRQRQKKPRTKKKTSKTKKTPSLSTSSQETFYLWVLPIPISPRIDADLLFTWLRSAFANHCCWWLSTPLARPPQTSFPMAPVSTCVPQFAESHNPLSPTTPWPLPLPILLFCHSFKVVESMSPLLDCFRQVHHNHSVFGTLLRCLGEGRLGGGFVRVCGRENGCRGVHKKPHSNQLTPNMSENLGKPADMENEGRFILMLQPLGLVVSWANTNKPNKAVGTLPQNYDVGHEPIVERRRALRVQCHERWCCHCRDWWMTSSNRLVCTLWRFRSRWCQVSDVPHRKDPSRQLPACLPSKWSWTKRKPGRLRSWTCEPSTPCTRWPQSGARHTKATGASPGQEMCDETAKLRCGAVKTMAPIVELHKASRMNPPSAYFMANGCRLWKLESMCTLERTMLSEATTKATTWHSSEPRKNTMNSWPSSKRVCSESALAANLESEGAANICRRKSWLRKRNDLLRGYLPLALGQKQCGGRANVSGWRCRWRASAVPDFRERWGCRLRRWPQNEQHRHPEEGAHQRVEFGLVVAALVNGHRINHDKIYVTFTRDKTSNTCIEDSHSLLLVGRVVSASVVVNLNRQLVITLGSPRHRLVPDGSGTATAALTCASRAIKTDFEETEISRQEQGE